MVKAELRGHLLGNLPSINSDEFRHKYYPNFYLPGPNTEYSIVTVRAESPVRIDYTKQELGLDFSMIPLDFHRWLVAGKVDPDIIELLGLPVARKRKGSEAPLVTEKEIEQIKKFGDFEVGDDGLYEIGLTLGTQNIYQALYGLWQPRRRRFYKDNNHPFNMVHLGDPEQGIRRLPQKLVKSGKGVQLLIKVGSLNKE